MPHPSVTAQQHPRKTAITLGSSGDSVTYGELDERSNQGAQLFRSLGLQSGDHIGIMMENNRQFLEIVWAAQRAGLVFCPINTRLSVAETAHILNNCGARMLISSMQSAQVAENILREPSPVEHFYMVGGAHFDFACWDEAIAAQPCEPIADESNGMPMLYSAGTTGTPKGISIPAYGTDVRSPPIPVPYLAGPLEFDAETVYLSPAPLYHGAPLHFCMMATYQGGGIVLMEQFEAERALQLIERHRVTHSQWVPMMFMRMLQLPRVLRETYDLHSMRRAIHSAAPCPAEVKEQMIDWWGEILTEYYSCSEAIGLTLIDSADWLEHRGSVGKPLVGKIHIVGEDGEELPPGEIGSVCFSGEQVLFKYHGEPEKTESAYDQRGWAATGDIGYLDDEGYLYLTGRKQFTIMRGGVEIHPQELENILLGHDKVADAAVIGVPHPEHGEEIKAVVELLNWQDATADTARELLEWLRGQVADEHLPRSLDFHPRLPRTESGHLFKLRLAGEYRQANHGQMEQSQHLG